MWMYMTGYFWLFLPSTTQTLSLVKITMTDDDLKLKHVGCSLYYKWCWSFDLLRLPPRILYSHCPCLSFSKIWTCFFSENRLFQLWRLIGCRRTTFNEMGIQVLFKLFTLQLSLYLAPCGGVGFHCAGFVKYKKHESSIIGFNKMVGSQIINRAGL